MRKTEKSVLYETSSLYVIGNTTYIVEIKFNDNSKETAEDVICDLIEREIESQKT
ncbi:MAG: transposon-encoded TnpW family protein [Oscillospiraceae bacterium]|nr:transposon-encoded TnpW family protein [Oscillospiraceae bacterium]